MRLFDGQYELVGAQIIHGGSLDLDQRGRFEPGRTVEIPHQSGNARTRLGIAADRDDVARLFEGLEIESVRKQADRMKQESEAVRTEAAVYVSARQTDVSTISNDEMRQAAIQRTANVKEKCDTIKDRYAQVNADFTQYIRSLSDLQTYLGNELNFGALDSGRRWVDDAISSGEMLRGDIRSLALEIELTSNILSPVPLAATQWPTTLQQTNAVAEQH